MIFYQKIKINKSYFFCPQQKLNEQTIYKMRFLPHYEAYVFSSKVDFFVFIFQHRLQNFIDPNLELTRCLIRIFGVVDQCSTLWKELGVATHRQNLLQQISNPSFWRELQIPMQSIALGVSLKMGVWVGLEGYFISTHCNTLIN